MAFDITEVRALKVNLICDCGKLINKDDLCFCSLEHTYQCSTCNHIFETSLSFPRILFLDKFSTESNIEKALLKCSIAI